MKLSGPERRQWCCFALTRPSSIITLYVCSAQSHYGRKRACHTALYSHTHTA
jgi:hypothetical protein